MSLSSREINALEKNPSALYTYDITPKDLDRILERFSMGDHGYSIQPSVSKDWLPTIIKIIKERKPELLTDDVKYNILYKTYVGHFRHTLDSACKIFKDLNIPISGAVVCRLLDDTTPKNPCAILEFTRPELTQEDIKNILDRLAENFSTMQIIDSLINYSTTVEGFDGGETVLGCMDQIKTEGTEAVLESTDQVKTEGINPILDYIIDQIKTEGTDPVLDYIIDQLTTKGDFLTIAKYPQLRNRVYSQHKKTAKKIVQKVLVSENINFIVERSKDNYTWGSDILFTDTLIRQAVDLFKTTNRKELILDLDSSTFMRIAKIEQGLVKGVIDKLPHSTVATNKNALGFIATYAPELIRGFSREEKKLALKNVAQEHTLKLLESMDIPNQELEREYILRNPGADTTFPATNKLSPGTLAYIDIIRNPQKPIPQSAFSNAWIAEALINSKFTNQVDWHRVMTALLTACPAMDKKLVQQMLNRDKNVADLIKRLWKVNKLERIKLTMLTRVRWLQALTDTKTPQQGF